MRNVGSCQWSLLGRVLMFATRNATQATPRPQDQRLSNAGSPPCAVMFTDTARSVA
jgi:hypothetical protein